MRVGRINKSSNKRSHLICKKIGEVLNYRVVDTETMKSEKGDGWIEADLRVTLNKGVVSLKELANA